LLFWQVPPRPELVTRFAPVFAQAETIVVASPLEQDLLCYLYFFGKKMRFGEPPPALQAGELLVVSKENRPFSIPEGAEIVGKDGQFLLLQKQ
jgi:hypothetical protein